MDLGSSILCEILILDSSLKRLFIDAKSLRSKTQETKTNTHVITGAFKVRVLMVSLAELELLLLLGIPQNV